MLPPLFFLQTKNLLNESEGRPYLARWSGSVITVDDDDHGILGHVPLIEASLKKPRKFNKKTTGSRVNFTPYGAVPQKNWGEGFFQGGTKRNAEKKKKAKWKWMLLAYTNPYAPCMAYLPTFAIILPLKTTIHVGKYTSPMDGMGKDSHVSRNTGHIKHPWSYKPLTCFGSSWSRTG